MPIEGPIPDLGVSDLLQLLGLSRRTGRLDATHLPGEAPYTLWLVDGQISGHLSPEPDLRLGRIAVLREGASEAEVTRALQRQQATPDRRIGEILVEHDALDEFQVRALIRFQVEEGLFRLLRWTRGRLHFQEESPHSEGSLEIRLSTDSLLLDAVRRVDEWRLATGCAGGEDPVPRLIEQDTGAAPAMDLAPLEWETLAEIDGSRPLREIAGGLARSESDVARAVQGLVAARVVEFAEVAEAAKREVPGRRGDGLLTSAPGSHDSGEETLDAATTALASGDAEGAAKLIDAFLARYPDSVPGSVLRGTILARLGRLEESVHLLDRVIELDPLHEPAYFHLASALVRRGDIRRARGALDTYLALAAPDDALRSRASILLAGVRQTLEALDGSV